MDMYGDTTVLDYKEMIYNPNPATYVKSTKIIQISRHAWQ